MSILGNIDILEGKKSTLDMTEKNIYLKDSVRVLLISQFSASISCGNEAWHEKEKKILFHALTISPLLRVDRVLSLRWLRNDSIESTLSARIFLTPLLSLTHN